jgi:hypothetical protein
MELLKNILLFNNRRAKIVSNTQNTVNGQYVNYLLKEPPVGMEPKTLCMLGKHFTTELYIQFTWEWSFKE